MLLGLVGQVLVAKAAILFLVQSLQLAAVVAAGKALMEPMAVLVAALVAVVQQERLHLAKAVTAATAGQLSDQILHLAAVAVALVLLVVRVLAVLVVMAAAVVHHLFQDRPQPMPAVAAVGFITRLLQLQEPAVLAVVVMEAQQAQVLIRSALVRLEL